MARSKGYPSEPRYDLRYNFDCTKSANDDSRIRLKDVLEKIGPFDRYNGRREQIKDVLTVITVVGSKLRTF